MSRSNRPNLVGVAFNGQRTLNHLPSTPGGETAIPNAKNQIKLERSDVYSVKTLGAERVYGSPLARL